MAENSWYAARVRIGSEENVRRRCKEQISSEMLKDCYVFHYEEKRHIHGAWIARERILFPGYVFLVAGEGKAENIDQKLRHIRGLIDFLKTEEEPAVLTDEEVTFLRTFGGSGQTVEFSEGVIEWSKVRVYSGPLVGKEK